MTSSPLRFEIHVRPGCSAAGVGGTHGGLLVVRVAEPAERGRATLSALALLAAALGVPRSSVRLVRGANSRRKLVEVAVDAGSPAALDGRLRQLKEHPAP